MKKGVSVAKKKTFVTHKNHEKIASGIIFHPSIEIK